MGCGCLISSFTVTTDAFDNFIAWDLAVSVFGSSRGNGFTTVGTASGVGASDSISVENYYPGLQFYTASNQDSQGTWSDPPGASTPEASTLLLLVTGFFGLGLAFAACRLIASGKPQDA